MADLASLSLSVEVQADIAALTANLLGLEKPFEFLGDVGEDFRLCSCVNTLFDGGALFICESVSEATSPANEIRLRVILNEAHISHVSALQRECGAECDGYDRFLAHNNSPAALVPSRVTDAGAESIRIGKGAANG